MTEELVSTEAEAEAVQIEDSGLRQLTKGESSSPGATGTKDLREAARETGLRQPGEAEIEKAIPTIRSPGTRIEGAVEEAEEANLSRKSLRESPCTEREHLRAGTDLAMMSRHGSGSIGTETDQFWTMTWLSKLTRRSHHSLRSRNK